MYKVEEGLVSGITKWKPKEKDLRWTREYINTMRRRTGEDQFLWVTSWYTLEINIIDKTVEIKEQNCAPHVVETTMDNLSRGIKVLEKIGYTHIRSSNLIMNSNITYRLLPYGKIVSQDMKIPGEFGVYGPPNPIVEKWERV